MHAIQSTLAGNALAHPAGPTGPTGPTRRVSRHRFRHAVSLAAIVFALATILGLASTGCDADRSVAASNRGSNGGNVSAVAAFSIDDLPATVNLSAQQRTQLMAAIAELHKDRQAAGHRFGARGRGRDHDGAEPREQGRRCPGARSHRSGGPGCGPGRDPGRDFGLGSDRGPEERPAAGLEPPLIGFLEKASSILNSDQFVILARFLAGRRAEMRPGGAGPPAPFEGLFGRFAARRLDLTDAQQDRLKPLLTAFGEGMLQVRDGLEAGTLAPEQARDHAKELRLALEQGAQGILTNEQWQQVRTFREARRDRRPDRRTDALPQHVDRITGMYLRVLGLEDAQAAQVRQIMGATIPARRAIAERRARENLEPEDFAYEMMTIEKNAAEQVRGVLTPDQAVRFDALLDLLPRGLHMGGPMGEPRGGSMGGPRGWSVGHHRGRR
jgi:hypothetical protein